jgi:hypothetical protein
MSSGAESCPHCAFLRIVPGTDGLSLFPGRRGPPQHTRSDPTRLDSSAGASCSRRCLGGVSSRPAARRCEAIEARFDEFLRAGAFHAAPNSALEAYGKEIFGYLRTFLGADADAGDVYSASVT